MIHEAAVFLLADRAAVSVFSRISEAQWGDILPHVFDMPGADQPTPLRAAINHYAYDNAWVPDMLAGRTMDEVGRDRFDGDLLGANPAGVLQQISTAATRAAEQVTESGIPVHCSYGDCPVDNYFWQLNIARTLTAHDVAVLAGEIPGAHGPIHPVTLGERTNGGVLRLTQDGSTARSPTAETASSRARSSAESSTDAAARFSST